MQLSRHFFIVPCSVKVEYDLQVNKPIPVPSLYAGCCTLRLCLVDPHFSSHYSDTTPRAPHLSLGACRGCGLAFRDKGTARSFADVWPHLV
jgi:hypothetical protein